MSEYPFHQLIRLCRQEIHITVTNPITSMSECSLRVIVLLSLVYPYSKLNIEQDEIRKAWFVNRRSNLVFWSNSQMGRLLQTGV